MAFKLPYFDSSVYAPSQKDTLSEPSDGPLSEKREIETFLELAAKYNPDLYEEVFVRVYSVERQSEDEVRVSTRSIKRKVKNP